MADVEVTITIERERGSEIDSIEQQLKALGLRQVERRERFGIVNGTLPEAQMDAARGVPGVKAVRGSRVYKTQ